jgi:hypothetical protein
MAFNPLASKCSRCGSAVPTFAASCPRCGASNRARLPALAIAGSLAVLVAALGIALTVFLRGTRPILSGPPNDNFVWLTAAMDECDAEAAKTPATLYFLVVPMKSNAADDEDWRAKSLNDIGNAILLNQQSALAGLKAGTLRIASEQYDFRLRDEGTNEIYKWTPSSGVKKFLSPNAAKVEKFKVQFTTQKRPSDEWGATCVHEQGTCYWVNAIIAN